MPDSVFDLPRIHTAIAEWLACIIYILQVRKRFKSAGLILLSVIFLALLIPVNIIGEKVNIMFWLPLMMLGLMIMFLFIFSCCNISWKDTGYLWARAFISAELAASLQWNLYYYIMLQRGRSDTFISYLIMGTVYLVVFLSLFVLESRRVPESKIFYVNVKDMIGSVFIAFSAFFISNLSFAFQNTAYSESLGVGMLTVRTLVDFGGLTMLFAQQEQRWKAALKHELDSINTLFRRQYDQYQLFMENNDVINRKYHDLKHQIAVIKTENDPQKKEMYLNDMERAIGLHEIQAKTGNSVLDVVLTGKSLQCAEKKIELICYADAASLNFIDIMDICSIFGNALDNAIESVEKIVQPEKRLIKIYVYTQNSFLMIRFENYIENAVFFDGEIPATTKKDTRYHGYGIKSIKNICGKYKGNVIITTSGNWFKLMILLPLPPVNN